MTIASDLIDVQQNTNWTPRYVEPRYSDGFAPGSIAYVGSAEDYLWQTCEPGKLEGGGTGCGMSGPRIDLLPGEPVFIIARPGMGNPWAGASKGVCYVMLPRLCRVGWVWAERLKQP